MNEGRYRTWVAAAPEPWRALWGKAKPGYDEPAHPLYAHLIDVAAVAEIIVRDHLPRSVRDILYGALGQPPDMAARTLSVLVALHDLGKPSPAFQAKVPELASELRKLGFDVDAPSDAKDHGNLGGRLLARHLSLEPYRMPMPSAQRVALAVAAHHGFFSNETSTARLGPKELGKAAQWDTARRQLVSCVARLFVGHEPDLSAIQLPASRAFDAILAGLTTVADWIGSMAEVFTYVRPDVEPEAYLQRARARAPEALTRVGFAAVPPHAARTFTEIFGFEPRPLQTAAIELAKGVSEPSLVLIEAPMGEGKTEAALYLAEALTAACGHAGLFFALPTQATSNQMLGRVQAFVERSVPVAARNLHLAHGEKVLVEGYRRLMEAVFDEDKRDAQGGVRAEAWFTNGKRTLLAPFAAGTVDQGLLGVVNTKHAFVRLYGLAGKVVVIDEVHAYDTYTSTLLDRFLGWARALNTSVVLLSATLPPRRRAQLLRAYGAEDAPTAPYPRASLVSGGTARTQTFAVGRADQEVELVRCTDDIPSMVSKIGDALVEGACVGWILNTVRRAQEAFVHARAALPPDVEVVLAHARLPARERQARESRIKEALGRDGATRPSRMLVIGTQVLEQSLDIDFDLMVTDLAPIDLILQRAGRLHRHQGRERPPQHDRPRLWLARGEGDPMNFELGVSRFVYPRILLRLTAWILDERTCINLPHDIEALIAEVYADEAPAELAEALARDAAERDDDELEARADAENAALMPHDDSMALHDQVRLDDPDEAVEHRRVPAKTRRGDASASVVCLHRGPAGLYLDPALRQPIDVDRNLSTATLHALLGASLKVARKSAYAALMKTDPPPAWDDVSLLRYRKLLVFERGAVTVGRQTFLFEADLGLVYDALPEVT